MSPGDQDVAFDAAPSAPRWALLLVALAIVFNLVALRGDLTPVQNLNDSDVHLSMIRWAHEQIDDGNIPLDGWFPYFGLGSPHFHHYQSFPHIVSAYVSQLFGVHATFLWTLYLLLALWPLCIYWTGRLFGADAWTSAAAALIAPFVASVTSIGYEHGAYTWRGFGTWAQLWGMWFLPLALALTWRAIVKGRDYGWAALVLGLALVSHFLTGYLTVLSVGLWVIVQRKGFVLRLRRAALVVGAAFLVAAWTIVPLFVDAKWRATNEFGPGTFRADSYGARRVLSWLFSGELFDSGRLPVITFLVLIGIVVCFARRRTDDRAKALLMFGLLSLLLYFGRPTLGPLLKLVPGMSDTALHRYILGVHLAGIFFAGVTVVTIGGALLRAVRARRPTAPRFAAAAAVAALVCVWLIPAALERWSFNERGRDLIAYQQDQDATDGADVRALIARAKSSGDGRIYAGLRSNWGAEYKVGATPVTSILASQDADAIGFTLRTASLATNVEAYFEEARLSNYELLNVRHVILPAQRQPAVDADLVERRGRHTLWSVKTSGYMELVDMAGQIVADQSNLGRGNRPFLASDLIDERVYPAIAYAGDAPASPTLTGPVPEDPPGKAVERIVAPADGVFAGDVDAKRRSVVVLKTSYDPRWRVRVDGRPVRPVMVAPAFVGAVVPAGDHAVSFSYDPFPNYGWLLALGALALIGLFLGPRLIAGARAEGSGRPQTGD